MVSISPRTIIITAPVVPKLSPVAKMADEMETYEEMDTDGGPRKRRRLNHLSPDERAMRRKLKNRVAAQVARDRKKARMDELEEMIAQLEQENQKLRSENLSLNSRQETLANENNSLRSQLNMPSAPSAHTVAPGQSLLVKQDVRSNFESAALDVVPLQKEPTHALQISSHCLAWMMTASLICCLASCNKSKMVASQQMTSQLPSVATLKPAQNSLHPAWWGPQQQSWNPSKN